VRTVFADTLYWGALLHPHDQYRGRVIRTRKMLGEVHLVTTDEVLMELLDGLTLYERRSDKGYSLAGCISMNTMRREGITEVLTNDYHFAQEGFAALLR